MTNDNMPQILSLFGVISKKMTEMTDVFEQVAILARHVKQLDDRRTAREAELLKAISIAVNKSMDEKLKATVDRLDAFERRMPDSGR
jgi:hypothetical protein